MEKLWQLYSWPDTFNEVLEDHILCKKQFSIKLLSKQGMVSYLCVEGKCKISASY